MEAYEREARRKEKEVAQKKSEHEVQLREARLKQLEYREHVIAVEAMKTKQEFFEILRKQQAEEERIKKQQEVKFVKSREYASEIKGQIANHEVQKKKTVEVVLKEAKKESQARDEYKKHISDIKERKLQELEGLGVPEKYCNEIRRKMKFLENEKISKQPVVRAQKAGKAGAEK